MTRRIDDRWLLPIEGLVSGVLTSLISMHLVNQLPKDPSSILFFLVIVWCLGLIFGIVIAAQVRLFCGVRSRSHLIGFVAACVVSYPAAFYSTRLTPFSPEFLNFSGIGPGAIDSSRFFFPGFVGSAIVCAGTLLFLVSPGSLTLRQLTTFLLKALGGSLACAGLGVFGWAFGERVAILAWLPVSHDALPYYALSAILQMGAASLVGILMPRETMPVAPEPAAWPGLLALKVGRAAQSAAAVALLILTYGTLIEFERIHVSVSVHHELVAERRLAAGRPSLNHLPAIVAPPVGQVLLLKDISGYPPAPAVGPRFLSEGEWGGVKDVSYEVSYKRSATAGQYEAPFAEVVVTIYPTQEWAIYSVKQMMRYWAAKDPKAVKTVMVLGNKVIRDVGNRDPTGGRPPDFYWASGNRFVDVTFWAAEDDEFLKDYLIWYPSTL